MGTNGNQQNESARLGARRIIEHAPKVMAAFVGIGGLAYLAGSIYTKSYFAEFGASWILDEVPTATYFNQDWIPLLLILFLGYLATTNLALIEKPHNLTASTRFKVSVAVAQYGPWFLIALLAMIPLLSTFGYAIPAIAMSAIAVVLLLLLFSSSLELLVVRFSKADPSIDLSMAYVSFAVIAAGLYVVPAQLGVNWARIDKQGTSSLPTLYLPGNGETEYKLLFSAGERLYVFPAKFEGTYPPVETVPAANVNFVRELVKE